MRKQKEHIEPDILKPPFVIFQFIKIEGIRGKDIYKKSRFVSPIFGHSVKDVVTVPFTIKDTGDTTRRFDAFRTKAKLSEEEAKRKYGNKYYEFTNIISNQTRVEYFGESNYVPTNEKQVDEVVKRKIISPIGSKQVTKPKEEETPFKVYFEPKKVVSMQPVEEPKVEKEPFVDTYKRRSPVTQSEIKTSEFVFKQEDEEKQVIPQRHRYQDDSKPVYQFPSVKLFSKKDRDLDEKPAWLLDQIDVINATLKQFQIEGEVIGSRKGPTVTRYEIALEPGVNVKRISNIQDNLMMNLSSKSLRIEAPIPGKPYVGLEVPNVKPEIVAFGNIVDSKEFLDDHDHPLKVALGMDIDGENIYIDIQSMPHGLIAGATNSGKSVCVNTILVSLLLKNSPDDLKLILIDPKMVELTPYNDLPHLITPVITDVKMASAALNWAVNEMEKRYQLFSNNRSRDIKSFNEQVKRGLINEDKMPLIVIVIDELADLMITAPHEVEDSIQRITQKARAAGIHLLVATQRPTTDVVKGTIKSNIPVRIAFKVAGYTDSIVILDYQGAESLLGKGDMLLKRTDRAHRLQGAFISDQEIYAVTDFIRLHHEPNYVFMHESLKQQARMKDAAPDELFEDIAFFVVESGNASINNIQKEFTLGFNRAQRIVEMLEEYQIVTPQQGTKAREVMVNLQELKRILGHDE